MSYKIKVLFADNIGNQYLKHDSLIEGGASYSSGNTTISGEIPVAMPSYNKNKNLLLFKFQVVDVETRSAVPFVCIKSLAISNDPNFSQEHTLIINPEATGAFSAWFGAPNNAYSENKIYLVKVGAGNGAGYEEKFGAKAYQGTTYTGDLSGYDAKTLPIGFFGVDNWEFSGNGGIATVYFKVTLNVDPTPSSYNQSDWIEVNYPENIGGYSQIVWQSERTPTPGVPEVFSLSKDLLFPAISSTANDFNSYKLYTGKTTAWRFRASNDSQSAIYSNGISKYIADIYSFDKVFLRFTSEDTAPLETTNSQPHPWRSIISGNRYLGTENSNGDTVVNLDSDNNQLGYDKISYLSIAPQMPITKINEVWTWQGYYPDWRTYAGESIKFYVDDYDAYPDIYGQAAMAFEGTDTDIQVTLHLDSWQYRLKLTVNFRMDGSVDGNLSRYIVEGTPFVKTDEFKFKFNEDLRSKIMSGALFELVASYIDEDSVICKAYLTPFEGDGNFFNGGESIGKVRYSEESHCLISCVVDGIKPEPLSLDPDDDRIVFFHAICNLYNTESRLKFFDLGAGIGKFYLDLDLGDCKDNNYTPHFFPTTIVETNMWDNLYYNNCFYTLDNVVASSGNYNSDKTVYVESNSVVINKSELIAKNSTFSKRFEVDFSFKFSDAINENFYVAVSNKTPQANAHEFNEDPLDDIKVIDRFNLVPNGLGNPLVPDSIAVVFDKNEESIFIQQVLPTGYVRKDVVATFNPSLNASDEWRVEFDFIEEQGEASKVFVALKKKSEPLYGGTTKIFEKFGTLFEGEYIEPRQGGFGYDVAIGSSKIIRLNSISIKGIPQAEPFDLNSSSLTRQFILSSTADQEYKSTFGQNCLSSCRDSGDYLFKIPINTQNPIYTTSKKTLNHLSVPTFAVSNLVLGTDIHHPPLDGSEDISPYIIGNQYGIGQTILVKDAGADSGVYTLSYKGLVSGVKAWFLCRYSNIYARSVYPLEPATFDQPRDTDYLASVGTFAYTWEDGGSLWMKYANGDSASYDDFNNPYYPCLILVTTRKLFDDDNFFYPPEWKLDMMKKPGLWVYNENNCFTRWAPNGALQKYFWRKIDDIYVRSFGVAAEKTENEQIVTKSDRGYWIVEDYTKLYDSNTKMGEDVCFQPTTHSHIEIGNPNELAGVFVLQPLPGDLPSSKRARMVKVTCFEEMIRQDNMATDILVEVSNSNIYHLPFGPRAEYHIPFHIDPDDARKTTPVIRNDRVFSSSPLDSGTFIVDLATTENIDVSDEVDYIDGFPVREGMKVLVKDQVNASENGIYEVVGDSRSYKLSRASYSSSAKLCSVNCRIFDGYVLSGGDKNNGSLWYSSLNNRWKRNGMVICQRVKLKTLLGTGKVLNVRLLEIKARINNPLGTPEPLRARLYSDSNGTIGTPLTTWITSGHKKSGTLYPSNLIIKNWYYGSWAFIDGAWRDIHPIMTNEIYRSNLSGLNQSAYIRSKSSSWKSGNFISHNNLVQFKFDDEYYLRAFSENDEYVWIAIDAPEGCELLSAYNTREGVLGPAYSDPQNSNDDSAASSSNWVYTESLWHNIYSHYANLSSNIVDGTNMQVRISSESQAGYRSAFSNISNSVFVDITPPAPIDVSTPVLQEYGGSNISAQNISATQFLLKAKKESGSPLMCFRVVKQIDQGISIVGPWMPWSDYLTTESNTVQYSVFHNGTYHKTKKGVLDTTLLNQNFNFDNARRIRVQVADYVGNILESNAVHVSTGHYGLVDTNPPVIEGVTFIDQHSNAVKYFNSNHKPTAVFDAHDVATGIKDFRIRQATDASSQWSEWTPIKELVPLSESFLARDGISKVEIQLRDFGNNITQKETNVNRITDDSQRSFVLSNTEFSKILFNKILKYQYGDNDCVYIAGIKSRSYNVLRLELNSPNGTEYIAYDVDGQPLIFRDIDEFVEVRIDNLSWTRVFTESLNPNNREFFVDSSTGNLVFSQNISNSLLYGGLLNNTSSINVVRDSAVLYKWDNQQLLEVVDLGRQNERCILSLCTSGGIVYLGGGSGRLWTYNTKRVSMPVFTEPNRLPINLLFVHQFQHEVQPYIYIGTASFGDKNAKLYRSPVQVAKYNYGWTGLDYVNSNELLPSGIDYTCAVSAYDILFLGTSDKYILKYTRRQQGTEGFIEKEELSLSEIKDSGLGFNSLAKDALTPDNTLPIYDIKTAGNLVLASIGNKPEIWVYSQEIRKNVLHEQLWSKINFNRDFVYSPEPWQFYGTKVTAGTQNLYYHSLTRNNNNISWTSISDSQAPNGYREAMVFTGKSGEYGIFSLSSGSDWEQLMRPVDNMTPSKYTLDLEIMQISGNGYQGIEIKDGAYAYSLHFSNDNLKIVSGKNIRIKTLTSTGGVSNINQAISMFSRGSTQLQYPENGTQYIWDFSASDREDRGPYWIGNNTSQLASSSEYTVWRITNEANKSLLNEDEYTDTMTKKSASMLLSYKDGKENTSPILYTDFSSDLSSGTVEYDIYQNGMRFDTQSKVLIRIKIPKNANSDLNNQPKLRMTWCHELKVDIQNMYWIEQNLEVDGEYHTYAFEPAWSSGVKFLAFEFVDCPQQASFIGTAKGFAAIDYIAITSRISHIDNANFANVNNVALRNYHEALTSLRVARDGKKIKVWLGQMERPIFEEDNFLAETTQGIEIRFGKLDSLEVDSTWMYGSLRFISGYNIPPLTRDIYDFKLAWRLPSTGAAKCFVYQQGTIGLMADGMGLLDNRFMNPSDNMVKNWIFDKDRHIWTPIPTPKSRLLENNESIVAVYSAIDYKNSVLFVGERGRISYTV